VLNSVEGKELKIKDHLVLWEFKEVFPEEVFGIPPKRDLDFSIDLVPRAVPVSKVPYRMSIQKLVEMKVQSKKMFDKGYIRPSVSPWGEPDLFVKKKDGTLRLCIDYK
jgi:hypothetical protein